MSQLKSIFFKCRVVSFLNEKRPGWKKSEGGKSVGENSPGEKYSSWGMSGWEVSRVPGSSLPRGDSFCSLYAGS